MGVPAYDGGLFSADPVVSPAGAALADIRLPTRTSSRCWITCFSSRRRKCPGPSISASLGVREFGTIYEGLLNSELSVADQTSSSTTRARTCPARAASPSRSSARARSTFTTVPVPASPVRQLFHQGLRRRALARPRAGAGARRPSRPRSPRSTRPMPPTRSSTSASPTSRWAPGTFWWPQSTASRRRIADYLSRRPLAGHPRGTRLL